MLGTVIKHLPMDFGLHCSRRNPEFKPASSAFYPNTPFSSPLTLLSTLLVLLLTLPLKKPALHSLLLSYLRELAIKKNMQPLFYFKPNLSCHSAKRLVKR